MNRFFADKGVKLELLGIGAILLGVILAPAFYPGAIVLGVIGFGVVAVGCFGKDKDK